MDAIDDMARAAKPTVLHAFRRFNPILHAGLTGIVAFFLMTGPCRAESYPKIAGAYHATSASPRVFDTPEDLHGMVERIRDAHSFSARMWAKLARQAKADIAAPVDWDATYSGCDIDIYLHTFSYEPADGYAQEQRSAAQLGAAMHVKTGLQAPRGGAPVAARLALYAALLKAGAPSPAGSPTMDQAAALSRRILLAWAENGFRDGPDRYKQKPQEFCEGDKRDLVTQTGVGLQVGRGVIYSVQAQDLLTGVGALSTEDRGTLDAFHTAIWNLVRFASNFAAEPEFRQPDRICEIYSNHRAMHLLAMLAISRLLNNETWFDQALSGDVQGAPPLSIALAEYFDHAIYGEHDQPIACYKNPGPDSLTSKPNFQTAMVAPGEMEDRYRHLNALQGVGYPMFAMGILYFDGLVLKNAGLDLFAYRGRHGQSIRMATNYYACYARNVGIGKRIDPTNARKCPGNAQYDGQVVNGVEENILMGAWAYPQDQALTDLAATAEAESDGLAVDAITFGRWPR